MLGSGVVGERGKGVRVEMDICWDPASVIERLNLRLLCMGRLSRFCFRYTYRDFRDLLSRSRDSLLRQPKSRSSYATTL